MRSIVPTRVSFGGGASTLFLIEVKLNTELNSTQIRTIQKNVVF